MKKPLLITLTMAYGLTDCSLSMADNDTYLCTANSAYQIDSSGKLAPEKGLWSEAMGSQGIPFSINRNSGEMIGTGFNTDGGWSVEVLNNGKRTSKETTNYQAIITSMPPPQSNNQVQHTRSIYVHEEAMPKKPFIMSDGATIITGLCE